VITTEMSAQLGMLDRLMAVANATQDGDEILRQSLAIVCETCDAGLAALYLVEDQASETAGLRLAAQHGIVHDIGGLQLLDRHGAFGQACIDRLDMIILPVSGLCDDALAQSLLAFNCRVLIGLPLLAHTEPVGCLILGVETATLHERDHSFLRTMGRAIGLAIDNAQLYQQMERRLRESQTLYEISRALSSTLDLDALLHLIVRLAVDTIANADNGVLHLLDQETGELHPRALSFIGEVRPDRSGRSGMRIGEGVAGIALERGELMNVPDVSKDERFVRVGEMRHFASMIVVPLKMAERRLGTLSIDSKRPNAFTTSDEQLLTTLAAQATVALENARLVHDLQKSLLNLKQTQAQLIQSAKLSAIGQLIAGVAHELNNPLTAVMGYTQLVQTTPGLDRLVQRDLRKIYDQASRAAKIVQNLLTFAREYRTERQAIDVNEILRRTLELRLYQLQVENISVETKFAPGELVTWADGNQLQQVFLNLINNAQDAMVAHRGGGHLCLATWREGDMIRIEVADDGPGLSPEARRHLFEPFFTTKEVGRGTGLGLSICFGIISEHGGEIQVHSEPQKGTTVSVLLPAAHEERLRPPTTTEAEAPRIANGAQRLSYRTLVVDDERDVAQLLQRLLLDRGYEVVLAANGEEALRELSGADDRSFDLIISDIKMPGLDGCELYAHLKDIAPELRHRILFITGDTLSPTTSAFLEHSGLPHLNKPFGLNELSRALVQVFKDDLGSVPIFSAGG
jgi:signal transduction histidine kinase/CheY-like chemotaxis protein